MQLLTAMSSACSRSGRYDKALEFAAGVQSQLAMTFSPEAAEMSETVEIFIKE